MMDDNTEKQAQVLVVSGENDAPAPAATMLLHLIPLEVWCNVLLPYLSRSDLSSLRRASSEFAIFTKPFLSGNVHQGSRAWLVWRLREFPYFNEASYLRAQLFPATDELIAKYPLAQTINTPTGRLINLPALPSRRELFRASVREFRRPLYYLVRVKNAEHLDFYRLLNSIAPEQEISELRRALHWHNREWVLNSCHPGKPLGYYLLERFGENSRVQQFLLDMAFRAVDELQLHLPKDKTDFIKNNSQLIKLFTGRRGDRKEELDEFVQLLNAIYPSPEEQLRFLIGFGDCQFALINHFGHESNYAFDIQCLATRIIQNNKNLAACEQFLKGSGVGMISAAAIDAFFSYAADGDLERFSARFAALSPMKKLYLLCYYERIDGMNLFMIAAYNNQVNFLYYLYSMWFDYFNGLHNRQLSISDYQFNFVIKPLVQAWNVGAESVVYMLLYIFEGDLTALRFSSTYDFRLSLSLFSHVELTQLIIDRYMASFSYNIGNGIIVKEDHLRTQYIMHLFSPILPAIIEQQDSQALSLLFELSGVESVPISDFNPLKSYFELLCAVPNRNDAKPFVMKFCSHFQGFSELLLSHALNHGKFELAKILFEIADKDKTINLGPLTTDLYRWIINSVLTKYVKLKEVLDMIYYLFSREVPLTDCNPILDLLKSGSRIDNQGFNKLAFMQQAPVVLLDFFIHKIPRDQFISFLEQQKTLLTDLINNYIYGEKDRRMLERIFILVQYGLDPVVQLGAIAYKLQRGWPELLQKTVDYCVNFRNKVAPRYLEINYNDLADLQLGNPLGFSVLAQGALRDTLFCDERMKVSSQIKGWIAQLLRENRPLKLFLERIRYGEDIVLEDWTQYPLLPEIIAIANASIEILHLLRNDGQVESLQTLRRKSPAAFANIARGVIRGTLVVGGELSLEVKNYLYQTFLPNYSEHVQMQADSVLTAEEYFKKVPLIKALTAVLADLQHAKVQEQEAGGFTELMRFCESTDAQCSLAECVRRISEFLRNSKMELVPNTHVYCLIAQLSPLINFDFSSLIKQKVSPEKIKEDFCKSFEDKFSPSDVSAWGFYW